MYREVHVQGKKFLSFVPLSVILIDEHNLCLGMSNDFISLCLFISFILWSVWLRGVHTHTHHFYSHTHSSYIAWNFAQDNLISSVKDRHNCFGVQFSESIMSFHTAECTIPCFKWNCLIYLYKIHNRKINSQKN